MWSLREIISLFFGKCEVIKKIVLGYRRLTYTWQLVSNPIKTSYFGSSFPVFHILSKIPKKVETWLLLLHSQKQLSRGVILKSWNFFLKCCKIHLKASVSESLFTVPDVRNTTSLKRDPNTRISISAILSLRKSLLNAGV